MMSHHILDQQTLARPVGPMALAVGHCEQLSPDTGVVPNLRKRSTVVPVPKNNQPREFDDAQMLLRW